MKIQGYSAVEEIFISPPNGPSYYIPGKI